MDEQQAAELVNSAAPAIFGGIMLVVFVVALAMYIYMALALQTIAKKTGTANGWLAWIPIVNLFLILQIAQKPLWWFILFLIPFVNIVVGIITFMAIAVRRGKPEWIGVLIVVPFVNIFVPGYLAWA